MSAPRGRTLALIPLLLLVANFETFAQKVNLLQQEQVHLRIQPLNAPPAPETAPELLEFPVDPEDGGETRFVLLWPDSEHQVQVLLKASERTSDTLDTHLIALQAELTLADGREVTSERLVRVDGQTTALFELYSEAGESLTVALVAETERVTVVSSKLRLGAPIRFRLEIQRVEAGKTASLETNELNTFVGQSVGYSFDLGGPQADSARLTLLPIRIQGDVAVIEVEISGRLPTSEGPQLISRQERWVSSRGVASIVGLEHGDPPTGYRFVVTPEF